MLSLFQRIFGVVVPPPTPSVPHETPLPAAPNAVVTPVIAPETGPSVPTIAIVNMSTIITDAQINVATASLQTQVNRDFAPTWKSSAKLMAVPKGVNPPSSAWVIYVMDTSDQAGALGYHDLTPQGNPVGRIFALDDKKYGLSWTVTLSHELLEMLADPWIQNTVFAQKTDTTGTLYALEVCDACEADEYGYMINGVLVSDFVYPTWFEDFRSPNSVRFDHMNVIHSPLALAPGGYIGAFTVPTTKGWVQVTAENGPSSQRLLIKGAYSRTKRRGKVRKNNH